MRKLMLAIFMLLMFTTAISYAAVPHLINYQGKVTDKGGNPLNGSYDITFRIYDAESAGNLLWEETQTGVVVDKGLFGILLGSVTALDIPFDKPYFLEIKVGTEVMSPRQRITSAGYAIRAEVAESVSGFDPGMVVTKIVDETGIGDGKVPVYRTSSGKLNYEILKVVHKGDYPFIFDDAVKTTAINNTSWAKCREMQVYYDGIVRFKFDGSVVGLSVSFKLYKNGVSIGTLRTTTLKNNNYATWSEDISVSSGDLIQVYATHNGSYMGTQANTRNFRACWNLGGGKIN